MSASPNLNRFLRVVDRSTPVEVRGRVKEVIGLLVRASVPEAFVGELCLIYSGRSSEPLRAEVVGFQNGDALLMTLGDLRNVGPSSEVAPTGRCLTIQAGECLLGRVLNGLGEPMDGLGPLEGAVEWEVERNPPDPMQRRRVLEHLATGVRTPSTVC